MTKTREQNTERMRAYRARRKAREQARADGDLTYIDPITGQERDTDNTQARMYREGVYTHHQPDSYDYDQDQDGEYTGLPLWALAGVLAIGAAVVIGLARAARAATP